MAKGIEREAKERTGDAANPSDRVDDVRDTATAATGEPKEEAQEGLAFRVETVSEPKKRGRPKGSRRKPTEEQKQEAAQLASLILAVVEHLAIASVGPSGAMLPHERAAMEAPLRRILERSGAQRLEAVARFADPIVLAFAFGQYALRIYGEVKRVQQQQQSPAGTSDHSGNLFTASPAGSTSEGLGFASFTRENSAGTWDFGSP